MLNKHIEQKKKYQTRRNTWWNIRKRNGKTHGRKEKYMEKRNRKTRGTTMEKKERNKQNNNHRKNRKKPKKFKQMKQRHWRRTKDMRVYFMNIKIQVKRLLFNITQRLEIEIIDREDEKVVPYMVLDTFTTTWMATVVRVVITRYVELSKIIHHS